MRDLSCHNVPSSHTQKGGLGEKATSEGLATLSEVYPSTNKDKLKVTNTWVTPEPEREEETLVV